VEHSQALDPPPLLQCSWWRPPTSAPYKTFPAARGTLELHHFLSLSPVSAGDETLAPALLPCHRWRPPEASPSTPRAPSQCMMHPGQKNRTNSSSITGYSPFLFAASSPDSLGSPDGWRPKSGRNIINTSMGHAVVTPQWAGQLWVLYSFLFPNIINTT
jgi:hypothetical protein